MYYLPKEQRQVLTLKLFWPKILAPKSGKLWVFSTMPFLDFGVEENKHLCKLWVHSICLIINLRQNIHKVRDRGRELSKYTIIDIRVRYPRFQVNAGWVFSFFAKIFGIEGRMCWCKNLVNKWRKMAYSTTYLAFQHFFFWFYQKKHFQTLNLRRTWWMFNGFTLWGKITIQKTLGFLYFFQKNRHNFQFSPIVRSSSLKKALKTVWHNIMITIPHLDTRVR